LQAEGESEGQDFCAAEEHGASDFGGGALLTDQLVGDQGEGDSGEKEEEWSREGSEELRGFEEGGVAGIASEPGVVTVGLEHEDAGEAAHPVDPS